MIRKIENLLFQRLKSLMFYNIFKKCVLKKKIDFMFDIRYSEGRNKKVKGK